MDRLEQNIRGATGRYRRSLFNLLDEAIRDIMTDADGFVIASSFNTEILDRLYLEAHQILKDAGAPGLADDIKGIYEKRIEQGNALYKDIGIESATITEIAALPEVSEKIAQTAERLGRGSAAAEATLQKGIIKARTTIVNQRTKLTELRETIRKHGQVLPRYTGTIANTELAGLDAITRVAQARQAGSTHLRYSGVLDNLTRPFCRQHLGYYLPLAEWEAMHNYTGPQPVSVYRGGYNCRHRLLIWNPEWPNPENEDLSF